jgi:predicted permease
MNLAVSGSRYDEDAAVWAYQRSAIEAALSVTGVASAAVTSQLPLGGNFDAYGIHRADRPSANPAEDPAAQRFAVSPDYLQTMGIAVVRGRGFSAADRAGAAPVALINRTLAQTVYGGEEALGKQLNIGGGEGNPFRTVVGIVDDVRHLALDGPQEAQVYLPWDQNMFADGGVVLVVRSTLDASQVMPAVEAAVRKVDPLVAINGQATMVDVVRRSTSQRQLALFVIGAFAAIALGLSAAGMFGVIAASVAERTREIGVRSALGASRRRIVGMVVRQGAIVSGAGLLVGIGGAVATGVALDSMLFGITPWDVPTMAGVVVVLALVSIVACALPAWRAARVDPMTALRGE